MCQPCVHTKVDVTAVGTGGGEFVEKMWWIFEVS